MARIGPRVNLFSFVKAANMFAWPGMSEESTPPPLRLRPREKSDTPPAAPADAAPAEAKPAEEAPKLRLKPKLGGADTSTEPAKPEPVADSAPTAPAPSPAPAGPAEPAPSIRLKPRLSADPQPVAAAAATPTPEPAAAAPEPPPPAPPPPPAAPPPEPPEAAAEPPKFKLKVKPAGAPAAAGAPPSSATTKPFPPPPPPPPKAGTAPPIPPPPPKATPEKTTAPFPVMADANAPDKKPPSRAPIPHVRAPEGVKEEELIKAAAQPKRRKLPLKTILLAVIGVVVLGGAFIGFRILTAPPPPPPPLPPRKAIAPIKKTETAVTTPAPTQPAAAAPESTTGAEPGAEKSKAEAAPAAITSTTQLSPGVTATTTSDPDSTGSPSAAFRSWVANATINGVLASPPRALINNRTVHAGQVVDENLGITFAGVDVGRRALVFRDQTGATVRRRY